MRNSSKATLVILLIGLLVSAQFIFGQNEGPRFNRSDRHQFIINKLNLTDEQQEAIGNLRIEHQKSMIDLRSEVEKKKLDLEELKSSGKYSREEYVAKVKALSDAKAQIALMRANHRMDVYDLLTNEQKSEFNKIGKPFGEERRHHKDKPCIRNF